MIKVAVDEKIKNNEFPRLMRGKTGRVVLFSEPGVGVCVAGGELGVYSKDWIMGNFVDFNGSITLSNEV